MQSADVVITTPKVWESISRRWRQRKVVQQVTLCIFECLQLLSPEYEVVCSRTRLIQNELKDTVVQGRQTAKKIRIIGLACPIANGKDVASWLGVSTNAENGGYFNFLPSVRPIQIEASILPYD
jgi:pre-mRNA-splicing helicase BRR2